MTCTNRPWGFAKSYALTSGDPLCAARAGGAGACGFARLRRHKWEPPLLYRERGPDRGYGDPLYSEGGKRRRGQAFA